MLELRHVSAAYRGREALTDVSLAFSPGEVLAVIGPNGSGKSTLLRTAIGLHPRTGGAVLLDGTPLENLTPREIARKVAYLPQSRSVPDITAWRMVTHGRFPRMGYPRHAREADRAAVRRALEAADALALSKRRMKELSGGERQKIYIAMALAQESETILMDEPTTYLDIARQLHTLALAKKLAAQGIALVLVLHDLPLAFRAADRIAVLRQGAVACAGTPEEVFTSGRIPEVFGVSVRRARTASGWQYYCEGSG